jgi:antitoxin PrlF
MATAILSSKGQITIHVVVRRKLGIATGDRVEFVEFDDGQFVLMPAVEDVRSLRAIVPKSRRAVTTEEMRQIVARRGSGK